MIALHSMVLQQETWWQYSMRIPWQTGLVPLIDALFVPGGEYSAEVYSQLYADTLTAYKP